MEIELWWKRLWWNGHLNHITAVTFSLLGLACVVNYWKQWLIPFCFLMLTAARWCALSMFYPIEADTKWLPFRRSYFQINFFLMKIIVFWMKLKFVPQGAINNKSLQIMFWSQIVTLSHYLNGLVQERHNSSALAQGLRLSCTDSMWPNNGLVRWCTCVNRPWWVPCFCLLLVWSYKFHLYPSGLHQWHWGNMSSYHFSENGLCNHNKAKHNQMCPDSKVHGDNVGPTWGRQDTGGPHVGPINFAI